MSEGFNPGIAGYVASGKKATRAPYSDGLKGHVESLEMMKRKIREGRQDPDVTARAGQVLHAAGLDGRSGATVRQQTSCLLQHVRTETIYTPDAVGSEVIQSAAATLCLRPGLCIRRGDCDDQVVLLCSLLLAVGIVCQIVKENYGLDAAGNQTQGHVLVGVRDERGEWFYADPSTLGPLENTRECVTRDWIDPMKDAPVEIIGIGHPHAARGMRSAQAGLGSVQIAGTWIATQGNQVQAGLRYAVGVVASPMAGWGIPNVTAFYSPSTAAAAANLGVGNIAQPGTTGPQFAVEQVIPGNTNSSWIMIGIARSSGAVPAVDGPVNVAAVLQEAPLATVPPPTQPAAPLVPTPVVPPAPVIGIDVVVFWGAGIALAGGLAYGLYRKGYFRR